MLLTFFSEMKIKRTQVSISTQVSIAVSVHLCKIVQIKLILKPVMSQLHFKGYKNSFSA